MKKIIPVPGLAPVHENLKDVILLSNRLEQAIHKAARDLSNTILELFPEGLAKTILQMEAFEELRQNNEPGLTPTKSFLEVICTKAIIESQESKQISGCFVRVSYATIRNIGLSVDKKIKKETEDLFEKSFAEISKRTNNLIVCYFGKWNLPNTLEFVEFRAAYDFLTKRLPSTNHSYVT